MRLDIVDFLRGGGIFTIVIMHLTLGCFDGVVKNALLFGGAGVHVFFICSGFGLYLSHTKNPIGYIPFLKRRFFKIYIPYSIIVIIWSMWYFFLKGIFPLKELSSHLLLYKMFFDELDVSLCYPFWFISTLFQFYFMWPLIMWLYRFGGVKISVLISLTWSLLVSVLGLAEQLPWACFFLQYLWEFSFGMWLADNIKSVQSFVDESTWMWKWLLITSTIGIVLAGAMAWKGGFFKLFNDVPSCFGYLSVLLIIYKLHITPIKTFLVWTNSFGYELYLIHSLCFSIVGYVVPSCISLYVLLLLKLFVAYVIAYIYSKIIYHFKHNNSN